MCSDVMHWCRDAQICSFPSAIHVIDGHVIKLAILSTRGSLGRPVKRTFRTMTVPPDSYQISVNIIKAIKEHPVLYCTEVKGEPVKLKEFKLQVWKYICDELGLDSTWVKLKWKYLSDTYFRILKCITKADKGVRRKRWIFEDLLNFLKFPCETDYEPQCAELTKEYVELINSKDLTTKGLLEQLVDRSDSEFLEVLEETSANPVLEETSANPVFEETSVNPVILQPVEETVGTAETAEILGDSNEQTFAQEVLIVQEIPTEDVNNINKKRSKNQKNQRTKRLKTRNTSLVSPSCRRTRSSTKFDNINVSDITVIEQPILEKKTPSVPRSVSRSLPILPSTVPPNVPPSVPPSVPPRVPPRVLPRVLSNIPVNIILPGIPFMTHGTSREKKLPSTAQADIRLSICKLVTEAEIKYCGTVQSTQQFLTPSGVIPKLILIPCSKLDNPNDKN
ncbi:PREDICTED: uncharacterized protein LOC108781701 [Cyphomyrmex costatus]|uniref:uncharacterized protein LOC108781701 n=1 Tax=Cyphomyrmex costatus TaxID=456900 RepID=UPI0008521F0A|nr:PREDICTED: uncharacterized protein LOC108781701 [Cyphomyrmex costatus]